MSDIKFYNLPYHLCSCRDDNNEPTKIARRYRQFYDLLKEKKDSIEVLKEMNLMRMCCRKRFLSIPVVPMIDRSKNRFFDDTNSNAVIKADTRELRPGVEPPDFPLLEA